MIQPVAEHQEHQKRRDVRSRMQQVGSVKPEPRKLQRRRYFRLDSATVASRMLKMYAGFVKIMPEFNRNAGSGGGLKDGRLENVRTRLCHKTKPQSTRARVRKRGIHMMHAKAMQVMQILHNLW